MDVLTSKRVLVLGKSGWEGLPAASPLIPWLRWRCEPAQRESSHRSRFFSDGHEVRVLPQHGCVVQGNHLPLPGLSFPSCKGL